MTEHLLEGKGPEWLMESATDAMIIIDMVGRSIIANPVIEQLFGYPRQELMRPIDAHWIISEMP